MNNLKKIVALITSTIILLLGLFSFNTVSAASYDTNTLESYGIPDQIIQVLLDNSSYSDGSSPASKGLTPATFTIGDVEQLSTVSLANRGEDGTSTTNDTVASWVASLNSSSGYSVDDGAYDLNTNDKVTGESGSLATKQLVLYGASVTAPFNWLMQIIATANNATTVDLTGITSKVTDVSLVEELLSLFQTDRLTNLNTLIVAHDNLSATTFYKMSSTIFNVSASQNVTSLDLSYNGITGSSSTTNQNTFSILTNLKNLNLAGNDITVINGWLSDAVTQVVNNLGSSDLGDSSLDAAADYNTLNTMMTLLNTGKGDIKVSDESINNLINAIPKYNTAWQPTEEMINKYLPQLDPDTISKLIAEDPNVANNADLANKLQDKLDGKDSNDNPSSLSVSGSLDFGTNKITGLDQSITAPDTISINATLNSHDVLKANVEPWKGTDGSTFDGLLTLPSSTDWQAVELNSSDQTIFTNSTDDVKKIDQSVKGVSLSIPTEQQGKVKTQKYTTRINWTVDTSVTKTQN